MSFSTKICSALALNHIKANVSHTHVHTVSKLNCAKLTQKFNGIEKNGCLSIQNVISMNLVESVCYLCCHIHNFRLNHRTFATYLSDEKVD